jgi:hexosaminidase
MFTELAEVFPSPLFHIGSDETFELGQGKTKELAAKEGLGKVYLDDIVKLYDIMKPYHRRLLFWADIAEKYPQLLSVLPKDLIANAWEYDAKPDFTAKIKPFRDAGLDVFVSPGSNSWYHIWPDQDAAFTNVRNFVRDGQKYGAIGMLNTTWDDDGEAFFGSTWPAMVLGAAASWQQGEINTQKFLDDYDWAFYRNAKDHTFRDVIVDLNKTNALLKTVGAGPASNDMFWMDPFSDRGARFAGRVLPVMHDFRVAAENALILLYRDKGKARLHQDSLQYMIVSGMRLDYLGMKVEMANEINRYYREMYAVSENPAATPQERARVNRNMSEITATNGRLQDLRDGITRLRKFYSDLWLSESRPYWLPNVQVRYDRLALLFTNKIEEVKAARSNGKMTPPEQLGFFDPIAPQPGSSMRRGGPPVPGPGAQPTQPAQAPPAGTAQPPAANAPAPPGSVQQIPSTQPAPAPPPSQKPPEQQ